MLPRLFGSYIISVAREALTHYEQNSPVMTVEYYMITGTAIILFGALSLIIRNCLKTKKTPSVSSPKRSDHFFKSNSKVEDLIPISEEGEEEDVLDYHKFTTEMNIALNDSGIVTSTSTPGHSSVVESSKNSSGNSSKNSSLNASSLKPSDRSVVIDEKIFF